MHYNSYLKEIFDVSHGSEELINIKTEVGAYLRIINANLLIDMIDRSQAQRGRGHT